MSKFKVGDRVRVTDGGYGHDTVPHGAPGEVVEVFPRAGDYGYDVRLDQRGDGRNGPLYFFEAEILGTADAAPVLTLPALRGAAVAIGHPDLDVEKLFAVAVAIQEAAR